MHHLMNIMTHQVNRVSLVCVSQLPRSKGVPILSVLCWELCARTFHKHIL